LFTYLSNHPDITTSKKKETHYFSRVTSGIEPPDLDAYHSLFHRKNKVYCEADPEYIYGGTQLITAIKDLLPNPKIIFMLREQLEKLRSNYRHQIKTMSIPGDISFTSFISLHKNECTHFDTDLIDEGKYYTYLKPWFDAFTKEQIKVLFFDDLASNPESLTHDIFNWLHLSTDMSPRANYPISNKSAIPKNRFIHRAAYALYKSNEQLLRRSPITPYLKKLYFFLNSKDFKDRGINYNLPQEDEIVELYSRENAKLRDLLETLGYENLPGWLR
jgi:hypothetical protein